MQSRSPSTPHTETTEQLHANETPPRQYGLCTDDATVALSPTASVGTGTNTETSATPTAATAELSVPAHHKGELVAGSEGRLNPPATPSPPSGYNRIVEYEKASAPHTWKAFGPAFEVIKKHRSASDKSSPIQELPNEILTHALAQLAPADLTSVSLVSKRFHDLVTVPYAWRSAFAHFFPGPDSLAGYVGNEENDDQTIVRPERRAFTRLTALASWRSEYIIRTRLLRSLARGKPVHAIASPSATRSGQAHTAVRIIMYNSQLLTTVNHLQAAFGTGLNKRPPRFIHGADDQGTATSSDPSIGKVDNWGLSDPQFFLQFTERFPGDEEYGLGPGELVGVPNVMDVSQPYGMIHGEGSPGGMTYFRSADEMRGRFLLFSSAISHPELGIPRISSTTEAVCSVWIAKSSVIPAMTEGLIGMFSGSSHGVLTAYSLGSTSTTSNRDQRFARGEMTARWVLSPGVPLISINIDNEYSLKRYAENRIWAVVANALGEVFYLTKFPRRPRIERSTKLDGEAVERLAWLTGRGVYWNLIEPSRRAARPDPYAEGAVDGSYSPRTSWTGMCLDRDQIIAETSEIEAFVNRKPKDIQKICLGWDMRRKLEVDFAGDGDNNAGESIVIFDCGLDEGSVVGIKRYTRCRYQEAPGGLHSSPPLTSGNIQASQTPLFIGSPLSLSGTVASSLSLDQLEEPLVPNDSSESVTPRSMSEEWRISIFSWAGLRNMQILATAIDKSTFATQTRSEDPLLSFSGRSTASSPSMTPIPAADTITNPDDIPGQRARLVAVGTKTGSVLIWDMRASVPKVPETISSVEPIRIIHTDSPQISCLALSSLYLVHGGNDGLVQAWDPLASNMQPIRTLNSRFSSRARRRLAQAQASPQGVGINLFAAGAICLDPDPTVLRGMVSLGTHLRYWSYSSSAADQYKSHKRRLRRSERGSNNGGERFAGVTRSNLKDYIANEKFELDRELEQSRKDAQRFAGRFGTELLDGSEEEMIAYAAMLSQESLEQEALRRASNASTIVSSKGGTGPEQSWATPISGSSSPGSRLKTREELDADIAEAIRQSLATSPTASYEIPIRHTKIKSQPTPSPRSSPLLPESNRGREWNDLELAVQLSLAEQQSLQEDDAGKADFPPLSPSGHADAKGKGRAA